MADDSDDDDDCIDGFEDDSSEDNFKSGNVRYSEGEKSSQS